MYVQSMMGANMRALVEFPLDGIRGATITSARIHFFAGDTVGYPANQTFSRITSPWEELTVTWNNQPGVTTVNEAIVLVPWLDGGGPADFDITQLVKDALSEGQKSLGLRIKNTVEDGIEGMKNMFYCTREHAYAGWRPYIEVNYEVGAKGTLEAHAYIQ